MKRMHITAASLLAGVLVNCGGGGGVAPSPTVFLQSSVGEVEVGEAVNISWSSSNADSCTASGDWSGNKASSGSESVLIEAPRTYRFALDCSGKGGAYSKSVSVDAFQIISGVSVDGYIRAADIFIDKNDNFTADSGEKISISDDAGSFSIRYSEGNLISLGGFDLDSGVLLDNLLLVNKLDEHIDFAAITPITTVMAFMDIPSDIYFALGIDVSIALASTDPVAMMGDSGIYDFLFEKGNQVTVLALAMQNISNDLNISVDTSQDYFKSIAQELEQGYAETQAKVDIEDRGFIGSVIANIVSSKSLVLSDESQAALAGALASVMSVIEVKDDLAINSALFGFATSTFQSDIKAIANETATEATLNSYRSDFINYISADLNISANDLTPEVRASEDAATTTEDQAVDILVLSNDSLVLSAPFNIVVESPLNGSVEVKSQIVSYTPNPDFNGTDIFSYSVVQGDKSASAVVTIEVAAANDAPSFNNLLPRYTVPENQISVVTILAIDVDEDSLTFSLSGADLESFSLDNQNNLIFKIAPDFESKALYSVSISVSDGAETITKDVAVEISNVNDIAPVIGSSASFSAAENQTGIGSVSASDAEGDALTYSVSGSELAISATGVLSFVSAPDYETKSRYTATVTVSDGVNSATQVVTVTVTNVNDNAPVFSTSAAISAVENKLSIGTIAASDVDGDSLSFSILTGYTELQITSSGSLSFLSTPDYETKSSYSAEVAVSDGAFSVIQNIVVTILLDTDSDGFPDDCDVSCQSWGMSADSDDDNDGVVDASDDYPLNVNVYEAPQATSKSYYMNLKPQSQTAGAVTVAGSVQAGSAKTFSIVTNGSYGTASLNTSTGYMVYTTNSSTQSSQEDTITFKVNDGYVDSSVATISFDLRTDPLYQYQWHLNNTGQTNFASNAGLSGTDLNVDSVISSGVDGEGIVVAVVDSGLEIAHEDLSSNVVIGSWDYVNGDLDPTSSSTDGDHGTSVAGIIAAEGWNKKGGRGVAPKASLVGYNFLAKNSTSNEVNSLGYGNSLAENAGVSIFNMSYATGLSSAFPTLRSTTIENALLNGVTSYRSGKGAIYVKSSGNDWRERKDTDGDGTGDTSYYCGPNYGPSAEGDSMPCWDASFDNRHSTPYLIGVASLTALNVRSSYSTPGASIWVSGFGGEYGTTDPAIMTVDQETCSKGYVRSGNYSINTFNNQGNHSSNTDCNYTAKFNGTSAAAPTVSGVVALMLEANPSLTWRDVKHILATTSTQVDTSKSKTYLGVIQYEWETNAAGMKFHNWYGFGRVDAASAVTAAQNYVAGSLNTFIDTGWVDSGNIYDPISTYATTTRSLTVSAPAGASGIVEFVRIKIVMNHAIPNNVGLRLRSPSGTVVNILSPFTRATINPNGVEFELGVNAFYGESMAGSWALVTDEYTNDGTGGTLNSWEIKVYGR